MVNIQSSTQIFKRPVKAVIYGPAGSGKTLAALTFPRPLVADAEGGTLLYCGREDIQHFHRAAVGTAADVRELVEAIRRDGGKTWDTLVIDPITVLYDVAKAAESKNHEVDMDMRKWGKVNSLIGSLFNALLNLPVHVVMIARESAVYEGTGQALKVVGTKADCPKDVTYLADYIIRMDERHGGTVEKSRGVDISKGQRLPTVSYEIFAPLQQATGIPAPEVEDVSEAALRAEMQDEQAVTAWCRRWAKDGVTPLELARLLYVQRLSEWTHGFAAADAAIKAALAAPDAN